MESNLNDSIDEQAVAWFIRLRADSVSQQDKLSFNLWLEKAAEHRSAFYEICVMWGDETLLQSLTDSAKKHGIAPRPQKKPSLSRAVYWL